MTDAFWNLEKLLRAVPEEGKLFLGDHRALLLGANGMGVLRKALIDTVGLDYARGVLTRCGYASGFEDARLLRERVDFKTPADWLAAGPRMHTMLGHVRVELEALDLPEDLSRFKAVASWRNSFEAEQHLLYVGAAPSPVCWMLTGYATGWSTAVLGERTLARETQCAAAGAPNCRVELRKLSDWDAENRVGAADFEGFDMRREMSVLEETVTSLRSSRRSEHEATLKFEALFDFAADMIWISEPEDGKLLDLNAAVCRVLGYSRSDLLGKTVTDLLADPRDSSRRAAFAREAQEEGSAAMTATFRTRSGQPVEVELRASSVKADGKPALLVIARDLNMGLREHRRALALVEAFRRSNDVMFYCDRNGVILDVNPAFTGTYGFTREEAIGSTPRILRSRHSSQEVYQAMWKQILDPAKGFWRGQLINQTKDGREIPVVLTITAVRDPDGGVVGYVSNAVDISEQVALQGRVAQAEALARLGEMAAVVAHEIRNPLGSIVMAAKQLTAGRLSKEDRDMVNRVLRDESQRLNETLTNFLAYARPRELRLELVDLNALLDDVCGTLKSNSELLRDVRLTAKLAREAEPFPLDRDQIRQVVWNLVLNALQAMDGEGSLGLETSLEHRSITLRVADSGPGIPEDRHQEVFKPFHTTKRQGTGLGLAIAERIVKAHGGSIEIVSRPGKGATFVVRLPVVQG